MRSQLGQFIVLIQMDKEQDTGPYCPVQACIDCLLGLFFCCDFILHHLLKMNDLSSKRSSILNFMFPRRRVLRYFKYVDFSPTPSTVVFVALSRNTVEDNGCSTSRTVISNVLTLPLYIFKCYLSLIRTPFSPFQYISQF
jgi:hypothetical protein